MVKSCWICKTAGNRLNKSYYRIPKILFHRNPEISELSALRKEKWQYILHLPDDTSGIRICSDHFLTGNPARLLDVNDPDWVPTKNLKQRTAKKEKVILATQKTDQKTCRLCFKLVRNELCANIFHTGDKKIVGMIEFILGHKIAVREGAYACSSCLKKVRVCTKLLTFFRRNEQCYVESTQTEFEKMNEIHQNEQISGTGKINDDHNRRNYRRDKKMESKDRGEPEGAFQGISLYDSDQIRSILEDNSVSSEEGPTDNRVLKCKRRKYIVQTVNVRPVELKTLKCNNCYRKFDDLDGLKNHKNFCILFYCRLCKPQIIFTEKAELEKHKKKYHCHPLVCHICGKNYSQSYLVKHFKNHFENRKKCPFCDKALKNMTIFMTHLDNAHGNRSSTLCEVCGGNFKNLKRHLVLCRKSEIVSNEESGIEFTIEESPL